MRSKNPDVVVVGAGIAGASIAVVLARAGLEVLLLERQHTYRDRVRGEYMAPWGVLEARAVGLEAVIRGARAVEHATACHMTNWSRPLPPKRPRATPQPSSQACAALSAPPIPRRARPLPTRPCAWARNSCAESGKCASRQVPGHRSRTLTAPKCKCGRAWSSVLTAGPRRYASSPASTSTRPRPPT